MKQKLTLRLTNTALCLLLLPGAMPVSHAAQDNFIA